MISELEYRSRREKLAKKLSKNSLAIVFSTTYKKRSNDTEYPFRQDSNFYYLTGFKEDNSSLILLKSKEEVKSILFVEKKDKEKELWSGKRLGQKRAKKRFLVDEVYLYSEFETKLKELLKESKKLYFDFRLDYSKVKVLKRYAKTLSTHKNIAPLISKRRLIKSKAEIELIQKAIDITTKAHHSSMTLKKIGLSEYNIQANIEYIFKNSGAYSEAYTSIVASGDSANTLHYIANNQVLRDGDLLLIDAGSEYDYYASDITRTIPINGRFTKAQKAIYELVLDTQEKIINKIKPKVKRSKLQSMAEKLLTKGMIKLGILKGEYKELIKDKKYKLYYPHGIGHWMGLDVHDEAPYRDKKGREIRLKEGMLLTIEPALYISKDDMLVPKKYRGIGVRIEDNILVTKDGYKNLSSNIIKSVADIEAMSHKSSSSQ